MNKTTKPKTTETKTAMSLYMEAGDKRRAAQRALENARAAFDNASRALRAAKEAEAIAAEAAYAEVNSAA